MTTIGRTRPGLGWAWAAAAALAGVLSAPARAQHGDPPSGLGRDERTFAASTLLSRSLAGPAVATAGTAGAAGSTGAVGAAPRLWLESANGTGWRGAQWRLQLDADSSLSVRLRGRKLGVAWRLQF